jgi:2,5-dichloro-2,5-cyclohexadiene-1,4-diol dehydrogenase 1
VLDGKVVIITGAASGIGEAAAQDFSEGGARLVLADLDQDAGEEVARRIRERGSEAHFVSTDVRTEADVEVMVRRALDLFGRLDGAFNNAGVPPRNRSVDELRIDEWDFVCDVNLRANFLCAKHQCRAMTPGRGGAIVFNSSVSGILGAPLTVEYSVSKHGLNGLTRALSSEFATTGVRVNAVLPGLIITPMLDGFFDESGAMIPALSDQMARYSLGRFGQPIDVARAAKWLLSDQSAFVNGVLLPVDAGFSARY